MRKINPRDIKSFSQAIQMAEEFTNEESVKYIPIDRGSNVSPRFDVIEAPRIGDPVSYGFNGDYYPDGHIEKISSSMKVITTTSGRKYYRRKQTASWKYNQTWTLVAGHHDERNPSF